ncbi:papain-like cysteine peptidase [Streptomyces sp. NPDC058623]|uniref:papain-like cysteine peptidase n=1 Tax=Streptomyces sp. NPDC058623 TaxID=3346563 RepID=UPI0036494D4E
MYDVCVGLGYHCESTYQIRRITGDDRAHFFDWLDLDFESVLRTLATDFREVLRPGLTEPFSNGTCALDTGSRIRFFHDFHARPDAPLTAEDIADQVAGVRAKFQHLAARWRELTASRAHVLYVHHDAFDELEAADLARLHTLLRERHPGHRFSLLWLRRTPPGDTAALPPGVRWDTVAERPGRWQGDDAQWDAAFAALAAPPDSAAPDSAAPDSDPNATDPNATAAPDAPAPGPARTRPGPGPQAGPLSRPAPRT